MKKNQAILVLISIFVVSAALGLGGTWTVKKLGANNPVAIDDPTDSGSGGSVSVEVKNPPEHEVDSITVTEDYGKSIGDEEHIMPTANITLVSTTGPTPNPETRTYSFTATASGGWGQYTYYLYPAKNAKDTLVSTSGSFANVTPISSGKYILLIKDRTGKEFSQEIQGFKTILKRLTPQQLTTKLSNSSSVGSLKGYFSSSTKIDYIGSKSNGVKPAGYTEIPTFITAGVWERISVTDVEYNEYNKIKKIVIRVY